MDQPGNNRIFPEAPARLLGELQALEEKVRQLEQQNRDLEVQLETSAEHGDLLQDQLEQMNASLTAEIHERQRVEARLRALVDLVTQQKGDLETLVEILSAHGDMFASAAEEARVDGLTEVANRRRFDEVLAQEWERHRRAQQPLGLLLCDVDHFKAYNDHCGHPAGDRCLQRIAQTLGNVATRSGDLVSRYGGEEFAILLPHTDLDGSRTIAEAIVAAVRNCAILHPASPVARVVTISVGVANWTPAPTDASAPELLVEEADRQLYLAKRQGRDRVA